MTFCRSWQESALSQVLQDLSCKLWTRKQSLSDERPTALSFARHALPKPEDIAVLSALAPRATDAALALIDKALLSVHETDLFDDSGHVLTHARVLKHAISVKFARDDGRAYVEVCSSSRRGGHVVLLSGIGLRTEEDGVTQRLKVGPPNGDGAAGGAAYCSCSCRAFEFKHANEMICKHIIVTGLAVASNLASFEVVDDEDFVATLNKATKTDAGYS